MFLFTLLLKRLHHVLGQFEMWRPFSRLPFKILDLEVTLFSSRLRVSSQLKDVNLLKGLQGVGEYTIQRPFFFYDTSASVPETVSVRTIYYAASGLNHTSNES